MRNCLVTLMIVLSVAPMQAMAGLDITAYSNLVKVLHPVVDQDGEPKDAEHEVRLSPVDYPERAQGLQAEAVYRFERLIEFRAGSYSGYNWWRNELAKLAGYPLTTTTETVSGKPEKRYDASAWAAHGGPFWELINFSDAEGVLGPVVCKKLYADFVKFHSAAMKHPDPSFVESYGDWEQAFKLANQNGALVFH